MRTRGRKEEGPTSKGYSKKLEKPMAKTKDEGSNNFGNNERRLKKYNDLPEYLKDNEYILDHYRCEWPLKDSFLSVFSLHNETLNIWTHLGGFLIFLGLMVMSCMEKGELGLVGNFIMSFTISRGQAPMMVPVTKQTDSNASNHHITYSGSEQRYMLQEPELYTHEQHGFDGIPRWPWFVFLFGAMACLISSSLSHLLACHSKPFNLFFWRLDYAGISLMIVCSFVAPIYYAFYCNPYARIIYITSISVLGILSIVTLLAPGLSSPEYRSFRAIVFLAMGFSGVVPAAHAVALHWGHTHVLISIGYELLMAVLYAIGAGFYVTRIPERWKPGAFDIAGQSHQIFHVLVVLAALSHCAATLIILDFRRRSPSCALGIP